MPENFLEIQKEYLKKVWLRPPEELEKALPAQRLGNCFRFRAFGGPCELYPDEIMLGGQRLIGPEGILIAMHASQVTDELLQLHPLKSFKELPHSMPYQGAFSVNAEKILQPYVSTIQKHQSDFTALFPAHSTRIPRVAISPSRFIHCHELLSTIFSISRTKNFPPPLIVFSPPMQPVSCLWQGWPIRPSIPPERSSNGFAPKERNFFLDKERSELLIFVLRGLGSCYFSKCKL